MARRMSIHCIDCDMRAGLRVYRDENFAFFSGFSVAFAIVLQFPVNFTDTASVQLALFCKSTQEVIGFAARIFHSTLKFRYKWTFFPSPLQLIVSFEEL